MSRWRVRVEVHNGILGMHVYLVFSLTLTLHELSAEAYDRRQRMVLKSTIRGSLRGKSARI